MPRPTIDEEVLAQLTDAVDVRTKVPAEHLGVEERLAFVLDELEEADDRVQYLENRVADLEEELEAARGGPSDTVGDGTNAVGDGFLDNSRSL